MDPFQFCRKHFASKRDVTSTKFQTQIHINPSIYSRKLWRNNRAKKKCLQTNFKIQLHMFPTRRHGTKYICCRKKKAENIND